MNENWNVLICGLDLVGAFVIICLMLETTRHASVGGFIRGEAQSRWAMFRRIVYSLVAIALFAKSVFIIDGRISLNPQDAITDAVVLFALIIFPALRALKVVDQDQWVGFRRRAKPLG